ncbi:STAS domain-containing protein [Thioclava sp. A2]|uniref:STAS domain-containing protein n=1 Tax=Thioclava sp. FCG-A2 TaxID=3080562 RepID=UPI002954EBCE|nr:STAS domain-containing protein [Thioclava sp. A2]MDV7269780.1 STAS domain-containing protein [Thioclava sp. A2]
MADLTLAAKLDLSHVAELTSSIRANSGQDLAIDASRVTHLGALALQVLVSAARNWGEAGFDLIISPRSDSFDEALTVFGVSLTDVQSGESA